MRKRARGYTLVELTLGMAIMAIVSASFASLLKYAMRSTTAIEKQVGAQEDARLALMKLEESLVHASEIRVASATFVEFVVDVDQSPAYDPNDDQDGDGIPNFQDADSDNDAGLLLPATAQWRIGFNLKDDDENGDAQIDVVKRLYLSGRDLWTDTSLNGAAWGGPLLKRVAANVSTFTYTYYGSKGNSLGKNIDLGGDGVAATGDTGENDGIISAAEMDMVQAPTGMGNRNGVLDAANERRYITSVRIYYGSDRNKDNISDYTVETDVYPPLLPLKSQ